ncbi:MAG: hypothetical protein R2755_10010 [Acidimicrobiales bacterium]
MIRALWWFTGLAQLSVFVQVVMGVIMVAAQDRVAPQFHMFYGFVALMAIAIIYSYRLQSPSTATCSTAAAGCSSSAWASGPC